ncbi:Omp28-related outer membrane protein [Psychroflexus halocasei]|uniref:Outer membrane protein Omp28 n=1 Tax=Psychroflexus halocasei TaxID=908615 RepID=A0A1H4CKU1_9FLAO|nr:Omp28-related outer membrane protein [Psychroflexus halocasei]SEA61061.1 Outer membrane protein Omp28 [Psychroflexus halocasei]
MKKKSFVVFTSFLIVCLSFLYSCEEKYEIQESITGIYLVANENSRIVGQTLELNVNTDAGENVTDQSSIFVNGELLEGNTFTTDEVGIVSVRAEYLNLSSEVLEVEFSDGSEVNFRKRALVEDYTGTWCGWCPRVAKAIELVDEQSDDIVFVAIHRSPSGTQDPYVYGEADALENLINTPGYPKGFINRMTQWDFPEPDNVGQVLSFTQGANPKLGLAISSEISGNQVDLDVDIQFSQDFQNLRIVVYLLENALVHPQVNYTAYYGGVNPVENYVHDHTLRATMTNILGDPISNEESLTGSISTQSYSFNLPSEIENAENIEFVAFVIDENDEVINVRKSEINASQTFEILE